MKIYNPLFLVAIGLFFTTYSQATIQLGSLVWGEPADKNSAFVTYRKDYDPADSVLRAISVSIGHSKDGEQRFYITPYNRDTDAKCNIYSKPDVFTMTFNDQAVKMAKFCNKFADANITYHLYTPYTETGHQFVVNLFKTSTAPVKLTFDGDTLYLPVKGFTKIWNRAGGNAI